MGDRFGRKGPRTSTALAHLRGKPPPSIISWGRPAIGHNGGPPIEEHANDAFVRWRWRKAHREAWKNPSMSILRFRVARAEAAGVSYERYMAELLDTGRHLQRGDVDDDDWP